MEMRHFTVGVDCGASNVKVALVDVQTGEIVTNCRGVCALLPPRSPSSIAFQVAQLVLTWQNVTQEAVALMNNETPQTEQQQDTQKLPRISQNENFSIVGVGVCCPGRIENGAVVAVANFPSETWRGAKLADEIRSALPEWAQGQSAVLVNDAKAALLGETWSGAAKGALDAVLVTVGTGIGGGVMSGGRLLRGATDMLGEIGHSIVATGPNARVNVATGVPGIAEEYCSATAMVRTWNEFATQQDLEQHPNMTCQNIIALAQQPSQNSTAFRVVDFTCRYLAILLINVARCYDPSVVVLTGGMFDSASLLLPLVTRHVDSLHWTILPRSFQIQVSQHGMWSGVVGAARAVVIESS